MPKSKIIGMQDENWKKLLKLHPEIARGKKDNKITSDSIKGNDSSVKKAIESNRDKAHSSKSKGDVNKLSKRNGNNRRRQLTDKPGVWFDGVDNIFLESDIKPTKGKANPLVKATTHHGPTRIVAMDCEMVGTGFEGKDNMLARISIVNCFGVCIYDKYVKPTEEVTDYRTAVSGIRPHDIKDGEDFKTVQNETYDIIKGRIVVGHALINDLKVLYMGHPKKMIRDTSTFRPFKRLFNGNTPSLKRLAEKLLGVDIQAGEHNSVQDAQAAMRLYTMYRKKWEEEIRILKRRKRKYHKGAK